MPVGDRILVTGARGFIGSHVVACARSQGYDVVAAYHNGTEMNAVAMDVCDGEGVESVFRTVLPSHIIHCAGYGVNYSEQDADRAFEVNTRGSLSVLQAAARCGVRRFVHVGSCFEYGSYDAQIPESARLHPTGIYGATKAAATILLTERARALGIDLIVARPFGVWGPGEGPHKLVPQVVSACMGRRPLSLTPCEVLRDYCYVEDVAHMIVSLALMEKNHDGIVVNIGSGKGVVLREFILYIASLLGGDSLMRFGELEYRSREMLSLVADVNRLHFLLGQGCAETPIAEGVKRMVATIAGRKPP